MVVEASCLWVAAVLELMRLKMAAEPSSVEFYADLLLKV